jgi:hypothetical protein
MGLTEIEAYDLLPQEVRRVLAHADHLWSSTQMLDLWRKAQRDGLTVQGFVHWLENQIPQTVRA